MPLEDFAPNNPAAVDEGKNYLIRGRTLKKLLAQDTYDANHFEVRPEGLARHVSLKPLDPLNQTGLNFFVQIDKWDVDADGHLYNQTTDMYLEFQNGALVRRYEETSPPTFPNGAPDLILAYLNPAA